MAYRRRDLCCQGSRHQKSGILESQWSISCTSQHAYKTRLHQLLGQDAK
jgi:hypothetical protein